MRRHSTLRTTQRSALVEAPMDAAWPVVASGALGPQWYVDAVPFRFRGALDRLVGGGVRAPAPGRPLLETGDQVGFWEVEDADHRAGLLAMVARVRAPGTVRMTLTALPEPVEAEGSDDGGTRITMSIGFEPDGLLGVAYLLTDLPAREVVTELAMLHLLAALRRSR